MTPPRSRANSIIVTASPGSPPTPSVSKPMGTAQAGRPGGGRGRRGGRRRGDGHAAPGDRRSGGTRGAARRRARSRGRRCTCPFRGCAAPARRHPTSGRGCRTMADGEERGVLAGADRVEQTEGLAPPSGGLRARPGRRVRCRRSAGDRCGPARRSRRRASSDRPAPRGRMPSGARRTRAPARAGRRPQAPLLFLAARVHDRVDERVVAEVGPAVVHVEHSHVDRVRVGGRDVLRALHPDVLEGPAGRARRAVGDEEPLAGVLPLESAPRGMVRRVSPGPARSCPPRPPCGDGGRGEGDSAGSGGTAWASS